MSNSVSIFICILFCKYKFKIRSNVVLFDSYSIFGFMKQLFISIVGVCLHVE